MTPLAPLSCSKPSRPPIATTATNIQINARRTRLRVPIGSVGMFRLLRCCRLCPLLHHKFSLAERSTVVPDVPLSVEIVVEADVGGGRGAGPGPSRGQADVEVQRVGAVRGDVAPVQCV